MLLGTKISMLYWRNYVESGCAIAGLHCISDLARSSDFSEILFMCDEPTDGRTDEQTNGRTAGGTAGWTYPLKEMQKPI